MEEMENDAKGEDKLTLTVLARREREDAFPAHMGPEEGPSEISASASSRTVKSFAQRTSSSHSPTPPAPRPSPP